jgi:hypothetical protein
MKVTVLPGGLRLDSLVCISANEICGGDGGRVCFESHFTWGWSAHEQASANTSMDVSVVIGPTVPHLGGLLICGIPPS